MLNLEKKVEKNKVLTNKASYLLRDQVFNFSIQG